MLAACFLPRWRRRDGRAQGAVRAAAVMAVAVMVACLAALIVLVQGLGSPSRGDLAVRRAGSASARQRASSEVPAATRGRRRVGTCARALTPVCCRARC